MKIIYYNGLGAWWGEYPPDVLDREDCTVAGGEAAFLQTAFGLAALGHQVIACHPGQPGDHKGVTFVAMREYDQEVLRHQPDAVVSWSDPRPLRSPSVPGHAGRVLAQQLNDLGLGTDGVDCLVSPSWSHVEYMRHLLLLQPRSPIPSFHVSGAGVTCSYPLAFVWPREPIVGYWSSPDRGLIHLLRVWPWVKHEVPKARLWVFYEIKRWLAMSGASYMFPSSYHGWYTHQAEIVRNLLADCHGLDVELYGAQPRKKLAKFQQQCRIWCYPLDNGGDYVEGLCVGMLEALAAGCWPVVTMRDALPTVFAGSNVDNIPGGDEDALLASLVDRLKNPPEDNMRVANFRVAAKYTWPQAAKDMETAILDAVAKRSLGTAKVDAASTTSP